MPNDWEDTPPPPQSTDTRASLVPPGIYRHITDDGRDLYHWNGHDLGIMTNFDGIWRPLGSGSRDVFVNRYLAGELVIYEIPHRRRASPPPEWSVDAPAVGRFSVTGSIPNSTEFVFNAQKALVRLSARGNLGRWVTAYKMDVAIATPRNTLSIQLITLYDAGGKLVLRRVNIRPDITISHGLTFVSRQGTGHIAIKELKDAPDE